MARYRHKAIGGLVKMLMIMTITIVKKGGHWPRCPGQRTPFQVEQWDCLPPRPHYHILQSPLLILHSALEPSLWWFIDANLIFWRFVSVKFAPDIFQTLLGWIGSYVKTDLWSSALMLLVLNSRCLSRDDDPITIRNWLRLFHLAALEVHLIAWH